MGWKLRPLLRCRPDIPPKQVLGGPDAHRRLGRRRCIPDEFLIRLRLLCAQAVWYRHQREHGREDLKLGLHRGTEGSKGLAEWQDIGATLVGLSDQFAFWALPRALFETSRRIVMACDPSFCMMIFVT